MSKFHLSQELTDLVSNAVQAFALRLESECKISKETVLSIWEKCSDDITVKNKTKTKKEKEVEDANKIQKILKPQPERRFALKKNEYGNYEHKDTGFVFDPQTKEVVGKQEKDKVINLKLSDIEVCNQYGFKFKMPERLEEETVLVEEEELSDVEELGLLDDMEEEDE